MTESKSCRQLLRELRTSQQEVRNLLRAMAPVQDWQREPAEWSFRFLAAHLAQIERDCFFPRIVAIASGEHPRLNGYVSSHPDLERHELVDSLAEWTHIRQELLTYVAGLPLERLEIAGVHPDIGEITVLDALEQLLAHDQGNARHIRQLAVDFYEERLYSTSAS